MGPPARRDIYREEDMGAPKERHIARETKAGPPQRRERLGMIWAAQPTGRAGTVIGMGIYGPACKAGHI